MGRFARGARKRLIGAGTDRVCRACALGGNCRPCRLRAGRTGLVSRATPSAGSPPGSSSRPGFHPVVLPFGAFGLVGLAADRRLRPFADLGLAAALRRPLAGGAFRLAQPSGRRPFNVALMRFLLRHGDGVLAKLSHRGAVVAPFLGLGRVFGLFIVRFVVAK